MSRTRRPVGRLSLPLLAAIIAVQVAILWAVYAITGSNLVQGVVLVALQWLWGPFTRRAAETRPFPRSPEPPPISSKPRQLAAFVGFVLVALSIEAALYLGLAEIGLYPGVWVFFTFGFILPLMLVVTMFGQLPPEEEPGSSMDESATSASS